MPGFPPFPTVEAKAVIATPVAPAIAQTAVKNKNVKILFFVVLFIALGFIGYFIVNTMYPMGLFNS